MKENERGITDYQKNEDIYFIYFIGMLDDSIIKIGLSNDPQKRLNALQTANPYELRLILTFRGDESKESELHEKYTEYSIRGEWFYNIGKLKDYIDRMLQIVAESGDIPNDGMTDKERVLLILEIIKELSKVNGGRVLTSLIYIEAVERHKMDKDIIGDMIYKLKQQGLVFEPVEGYIKTV